MSLTTRELEATLEVATDAVEGNGEYTAVLMKLHDIGETCSVENYSIMKNAVHLVNTYGKDFPTDMKVNLDVYTYRLLKSMQQPLSSIIHHYYHEEKEGQDLYQMVKDVHETLRRIEDMANHNNQQQPSKSIDTKQPEQQPEQQGDSATKQDST